MATQPIDIAVRDRLAEVGERRLVAIEVDRAFHDRHDRGEFIDINFAFSRTPGEPKRYVQDRIRERGADGGVDGVRTHPTHVARARESRPDRTDGAVPPQRRVLLVNSIGMRMPTRSVTTEPIRRVWADLGQIPLALGVVAVVAAPVPAFRRAAGVSPRRFRQAAKGDRKFLQDRLAAVIVARSEAATSRPMKLAPTIITCLADAALAIIARLSANVRR